MQVQDALPAEPDAIAAVSGQIASLAVDRANSLHFKQTEALKAALSEREAQATELQTRCDELLQDHVTLTDDLAAAHDMIARLEGEKAALASSVRTLAERIQKLEAFKRTLIASLQDDSPAAIAAGGSSTGGGGSLWGEAPKMAPPEGERLVQEILASAKPAPLPQRPSLLHGDAGKIALTT
jgi:prophage DNA circulation protein